jgi:hypothetical protein
MNPTVIVKSPETKLAKFIRGWKAVAIRYSVTPRSIQSMVKRGQFPEPRYMGDSPHPYWEIAALDEFDRGMVTAAAKSLPHVARKAKEAAQARKGKAREAAPAVTAPAA